LIGNRDGDRNIGDSLVGLTFSMMFLIIINYVVIVNLDAEKKEDIYLLSMGNFCGFFVVLSHLNQIIGSTLRKYNLSTRNSFMQYLLTPGGNMAEAGLKQSASYKVNNMITNALEIVKNGQGNDNVMDTYFGRALLSYSKQGKQFESSGGIFWTWKKCFNGDLFQKEGIWFTTRLLANNFTQLVLAFYILWFGITMIRHAEQSWGKENFQSSDIPYVDALLSKFLTVPQQSETFINEGAANFSAVVSDFIVQKILGPDYDCSLVPSIINTATKNGTLSCTEDGGLACAPQLLYNYCEVFNSSNFTAQELAQSKADALKEYGFDVDIFKNVTLQLLQKGAETSVHSLYPDEPRM